MGIFSDSCDVCGGTVKRHARFCSTCGAAAPKAWIRCTGCQKWVGAQSAYCPHCNTPQHPDENQQIAGNVLKRGPGLLFQQFDIDSLAAHGKDHFLVEEGDVAIHLEKGVATNSFPPGRHSIKPLKHGLIPFVKKKRHESVVVVDDGEFVVPFQCDDLRSIEDMSLNLYTEVVFSIDIRAKDNFLINFVKQQRSGKYEDFANYIYSRIKAVAASLSVTTSIDTLIKDYNVLVLFEDELKAGFIDIASDIGIRVKRVAAVEFFGQDYDHLRDLTGNIETKTRKMALEQRMRELVTSDRMNEIRSDHDLKLYEDQMAHEYRINQEIHKAEFDEVLERLQTKKSVQKRESVREIEEREFSHRKVLQESKIEMELEETRQWIEVRKSRAAAELEDDRSKLDAYADYSIEELAAILPAEKVELILKIRALEYQSKLLDQQDDMELGK